MTASAHAVLIERTFDVTASGFTFLPVEGPDTPSPVDPVELNFTLIWDSSIAIDPTATGLTINSFNLPNPPYSSMFAADGSDQIAVGTSIVSGDACDVGAPSYCVFIADAAGASPFANGFYQTTSSDGIWVSDTVTVTADAIEVVPEPSTWALMLIGFASLGFAGYRSRKAAWSAA